MIKSFLIAFFLVLGLCLKSQELNCNVEVVHPNIQVNDTRIFETLKKSIFDFMNNTRWTGDNFTNDERIGCSVYINISERTSNEFVASIQVQSWRPVYNTSYTSTLLNFNDTKFRFTYLEFQQLEFSLNQFQSNLTSVLAYYAYVILGLDYDSFSLNGGQKYFEAAQTIVNNAQSTDFQGWKAFDGNRNRYWLIENMLNPAFSDLRKWIYQYHRLGMDVLEDDKNQGRTKITSAIKLLEGVHDNKPNSFLMQLLLSAKKDEIINLYADAFPDVKSEVVTVLSKVDAPNLQDYQEINKSK